MTANFLAKAPTGISGLDEMTMGGLPKGRPTLLCGGPGSGKTLLSMSFIVNGALRYGEPGVFMSFEERPEDLRANFTSLGFDVDDLTKRELLVVDHVRLERSEIEESGEYDLEGIFVRLGYAVDTIGAKRVAIDTIEALFAGLSNEAALRSELRRLFGWLKERGLTAIITGERGASHLTRYGLEEYVSDCVIVLDNRIVDQLSTRRLRILKYRGSAHGADEYPFLIDERGASVLPISSAGLDHSACPERMSTGVASLDSMLGGEGYFVGSSILVSGAAGTGKSSLAAHFAEAGCGRGEKVVYVALEESAPQIIRNMASIGVDLGRWATSGLLRFNAARPSYYGLETHLAKILREVQCFQPKLAVIDPISSFLSIGSGREVHAMLLRLADILKAHNVTTVFTELVATNLRRDEAEASVSSLMDTWISLRRLEIAGDARRALCIVKSRGMAHSRRVREFVLEDAGFTVVDEPLDPSITTLRQEPGA
ncbi:circadian clock protein KaiC [Methylosinus sp. Sm6]|nr:circadian clock protein KaiC [Methylosinus sp. Sm6]MBY6240875.1 circadian clock protein KaiC [Methylosinus sp. Sm6]